MRRSVTFARRGDTFVEVMFAVAVFALVAIMTVATMNAGLATSERALELTTARDELNAQAEALRYIHSVYISELGLALCGDDSKPEDLCQHYAKLWQTIIQPGGGAYVSDPGDFNDPFKNLSNVNACSAITTAALIDSDAFIINTRALGTYKVNAHPAQESKVIVRPTNTSDNAFREAPISSRLVFKNGALDDSDSLTNLSTSSHLGSNYTTLSGAEGIWIIPLRRAGDNTSTTVSQTSYYEFYIQACWYGAGDSYPSVIDTVVHLYRPTNGAY